MVAGNGDAALALEGAGQRTRLAVEIKMVEGDGVAVAGVAQDDLAAVDAEPVDPQHVGLEADSQRRRLDVAGLVEPEVELWSAQMQIGRLPFAAHEGRKRELDIERVGVDAVAAARADFDIAQREPRRRQQPRVDLALHLNLDTEQMGRFRLEDRPVAAPVDQQRPHQRRHQRQDDRYRYSEQGRLQRQLQRRPRPASASSCLRFNVSTLFLPPFVGESMSRAIFHDTAENAKNIHTPRA